MIELSHALVKKPSTSILPFSPLVSRDNLLALTRAEKICGWSHLISKIISPGSKNGSYLLLITSGCIVEVKFKAAVWFPIAAVLTPANVADSDPAPDLLREVPAEVRFILGDRHYNTPELRENCEQADRLLVTTQYGRYPHTDDGVEVRRVFHKLRSIAMENFNEHFKGIFDGHGQVPTKGLLATQRFALGAIFVYQLALTSPL